MPITRITNPRNVVGQDSIDVEAEAGCWAGCWVEACWAGCWADAAAEAQDYSRLSPEAKAAVSR